MTAQRRAGCVGETAGARGCAGDGRQRAKWLTARRTHPTRGGDPSGLRSGVSARARDGDDEHTVFRHAGDPRIERGVEFRGDALLPRFAYVAK
jgi:hypothetical protein